MKKYILTLSLVLLTLTPAWAKPEPAKPPAEKPAAVEQVKESPEVTAEEKAISEIDQADLKQLVETLESDTARTEFLGNLKTLLAQEAEQKAKEEDALAPLTEQIGVRGFFSSTADRYEEFLTRHNLSGSLVNQTLGSVIVLIIAGIGGVIVKRLIMRLMRLADKLGSRLEISVKRLRNHIRLLQVFIFGILAIVTSYTLAKIWGFTAIDGLFESPVARSAIANGITVLLVVFFAALVWEAINLYLEYILRKANNNNQTRAKTLLPIIRNIVISIFTVLFGLVLLSELGINVTPLLAGAGVIGVAVGFGAQTMVKDFLSGFTIILEDIVRVGDVVSLAGVSGGVEKITLRKIQLRDFAGTVYTIPYSEIKTIQNLTKDFSYYVMDISVAYDSSIDHVIGVLRAVDEDLRKDDSFSFMILEPLEIAGIDKFSDSAMVLKCRIKTLPIRQWTIGREFNRRMKLAFDANGIEIPFPQRTINVRDPGHHMDDPEVRKAALEEVSD